MTRRSLLSTLVVAALVGLAVLRSALGTREDGFTADEAFHITAGVSYVRTGDFRLNPEHPPLVKLWVGSFLPRGSFELPPLRPLVDKLRERDFTEEAVYTANNPDTVQARARLAMWLFHAVCLLAFGLLVLRLFGLVWAAGTLLFLALDPTVAAHLPVVMTDLPLALLSAVSALLASVAFRSFRPGALVGLSIALGLTLGAKHSGLVAVGALVAYGLVQAIRGARGRGTRALLVRLLAVAAVGAGALIVLWALYAFRYHASPGGGDPFNRPLETKIQDLTDPRWEARLVFVDRWHLLPRAYTWGLADTVRAGLEGRGDWYYAFGRRGLGRPPAWFYSALILLKLPLGAIALALIGAAALLKWRAGLEPDRRHALTAALFTGGAYLAVLAASEACYAGVRHALPVFPPLGLVAGGALALAQKHGSRALGASAAACLAAILALSGSEPRVWEYHNELVGGTQGAWRYFGHNEGVDLGQRGRELAEYYRKEVAPRGERPYVRYWVAEADLRRQGVPLQRMGARLDDGHADAVYEGTFFTEWLACIPDPPDWQISELCRNGPTDRRGNLFIFRGRFHLPRGRARSLYHNALDLIYAEKQDLPQAEQMLAESIRLDGRNEAAAIELGNLLVARGDRAGAIEMFRRATKEVPDGGSLQQLLAQHIDRLAAGEAVAPFRNPSLE